MVPAYLDSFVVEESVVAAETWFVADKLLGFVGNSNFESYHSFDFDVVGYNNSRLVGDYNFREVVVPNSRS